MLPHGFVRIRFFGFLANRRRKALLPVCQQLEAKFPKIPPRTSHEVQAVTPDAIRASVARSEILMPEGEIRATRIFDRDGRFIRSVTPDWVAHGVAGMVEHPHYAAVHVPILSIYAIYEKPADLIRRYSIADEQTRSAFNEVFALLAAAC